MGHADFVVPVLWIPVNVLTQFPAGTIATGFKIKRNLSLADLGSKDKSVILWNVEDGVPAVQLLGHTQQVTDLGILSDSTLVSSSVDGCSLRPSF